MTLDSVERALSKEDLMICNTSEGMCIAGVFGGIASGISDSTQNVFLESAHFNPVYVRKTSKRHQLNTDASFRFERGTDPTITVYALQRAALLIKEVAGGTISSPIMDVYPRPVDKVKVDFNLEKAFSLIGKVLEPEVVKNILRSLDIEILEETTTNFLLAIPPYRVDVKRLADVVEEVLRIYGYNNIEISDSVHSTLSYIEKPDKDEVVNTISDALSAMGFNEIMSNSLTSGTYYTSLDTFKPENLVMMLNPLSQELNCMRQTLLFGGLEAVRHNTNRKNQDLKLYEFGNIYIKEEAKNQVLPGFSEAFHLALFVTGFKKEEHWIEKQALSTFYTLKGYTEYILNRMGIAPDKCVHETFNNDIFEEALQYSLHKKVIVQFGSVHKKLLQIFDIKSPVYYANFNWDLVLQLIKSNKITFEELPRFPEVKRDLSLVLNKETQFGQIKDLAFKTEKKLLKKINLFDVYEGDKIDSNKKSYAIRFIISDPEKTLTDQEVDQIMKRLVKVYESELGAQIRQ